MLTKTMKWVCIAALLSAALWRASANYQLLLETLVCVSALLVVMQAVRAGKYIWAAGFLAMAMLFNPVMPIEFSRKMFLWLDWACLAAFLLSLAALKRHPRLSILSITHRTPGSESL